RAVRVAPEPQDPHLARQRVEVHHAPEQRPARAEDQLDRLERLHATDDSGQDPEHPRLGTRRGRPGRRRLGEEAAVAGPFRWMEDGRLTLELPDRAIDERLVEHDGRVVGAVARREVAAAVQYGVKWLGAAE